MPNPKQKTEGTQQNRSKSYGGIAEKNKDATLQEIANKQAKHPKKSQNHTGNSAYKQKLIN